MMTVREWLQVNDIYEESVMMDADGNECLFWFGADDPKYSAHVVDVVPDADAEWRCMVITDYRG